MMEPSVMSVANRDCKPFLPANRNFNPLFWQTRNLSPRGRAGQSQSIARAVAEDCALARVLRIVAPYYDVLCPCGAASGIGPRLTVSSWRTPTIATTETD